jgi:hypothetical protein
MRLGPLLLAALLAACSPGPAAAPPSRAEPAEGLPLMRMPGPGVAAPPARPNAEMAEDILDLAFALESGRALPVLSRFEGPIRVGVAGPRPPTLMPDLEGLLARLRAEAGLDVALAPAGVEPAIVIEAVPRATLARAVPRAACFVVPNVASFAEFQRRRGSATLDWGTVVERRRAAVFVPSDAPPQEIRDCLHEELAQAIGPLNDLYRLPDSVFNDDNIHSTLTGFDMLVLRAIHALPVGATRQEAAALLPGILARLNPAGERPGAGRAATPRQWIDSIEVALSDDRPAADRQHAAAAAVAMSRAGGMADTREGFAQYALGRLQAASDPSAARAAFEAARDRFGRSPLTAIHRAHADAQLAAYALASGDLRRVLTLTGEAIPVAEAHGNAALLSTLILFRAEALDAAGRTAEADALRLDGLAWARYGFGGAEAVRARLREVQSLNPWRTARSMAG